MKTKRQVKLDRSKKKSGARTYRDQDDYLRWSRRGKPNPAILANIVQRIVEAAKPNKIVLFGSGARGTLGRNSDLDFLVIKKGKFSHWHLMTKICRHLRGKDAPVDVVLVTAKDAERYRDTHCLVICPALKEGKVVYDSEAATAGRSPRMAESSASQSRSGCRAAPRRLF